MVENNKANTKKDNGQDPEDQACDRHRIGCRTAIVTGGRSWGGGVTIISGHILFCLEFSNGKDLPRRKYQ